MILMQFNIIFTSLLHYFYIIFTIITTLIITLITTASRRPRRSVASLRSIAVPRPWRRGRLGRSRGIFWQILCSAREDAGGVVRRGHRRSVGRGGQQRRPSCGVRRLCAALSRARVGVAALGLRGRLHGSARRLRCQPQSSGARPIYFHRLRLVVVRARLCGSALPIGPRRFHIRMCRPSHRRLLVPRRRLLHRSLPRHFPRRLRDGVPGARPRTSAVDGDGLRRF